MTAVERPGPGNVYSYATGLGPRGYLAMPVKYGSKQPATEHGLKDASAEAATIERWFGNNQRLNLGIATGPQQNGINLVVIDIDQQKGGHQSWKALVAEHGEGAQRPPVHATPRGGWHALFDGGDLVVTNSAERVGPGIDVRGAGGYIVAPPSVGMDGDRLIGYYTTSAGLWGPQPVPPLWPWLIPLLLPQEVAIERSARRHPSAGNVGSADESPADFVRRTASWDAVLERHGWSTSDGKYWTRPGKSLREGHSAQLHDDGRLAIWTGEIPDEIRRLGKTQVDGGVSISLFSFIAAYEFGGDEAEFGRAVRERMMPPSPRLSAAGAVAGETTTAAEPDSTSLNLPPEFWLARPWLTHIRDAAWSMGSTPDGQLMAWLAHVATMTHPWINIPAIVRDEATFDLMTVVVGPSGSGKSSLMRRAAKMTPTDRVDLRFGLGLASGEGLIEAYYGMIDEVDPESGKTKKVRGLAFRGVNVTIDEGALLASLAGRAGWTGIDRLVSAWSGSGLSTPNASADRFRHVPIGEYRLTCVLGIQPDLADGLWSGTRTAQGFTGRLLMGMATGGNVPPPGQRPPDPGKLHVRLPDGVRTVMTFPPEVWLEVQTNDYAKQMPGFVDEPLTAHHDLLREKVAGLFAQVENRLDTTLDDWALATQVVETSERVRAWLQSRAQKMAGVERHRLDVEKGRRLALVEDSQHQASVARVARNLLSKITRHGITKDDLYSLCAQRDRRPFFDEAIASLVEAGLIFKRDGSFFLT